MEALQSVVKALVEERPEDYKDCVKWARHLFGELYHNQIAQLLYNFPKDQLTKEGAPFWAPPKRYFVFLFFIINFYLFYRCLFCVFIAAYRFWSNNSNKINYCYLTIMFIIVTAVIPLI